MPVLELKDGDSLAVRYRDWRRAIEETYPRLIMAADIRACDSEGALIRAAWRWWSTEV